MLLFSVLAFEWWSKHMGIICFWWKFWWYTIFAVLTVLVLLDVLVNWSIVELNMYSTAKSCNNKLSIRNSFIMDKVCRSFRVECSAPANQHILLFFTALKMSKWTCTNALGDWSYSLLQLTYFAFQNPNLADFKLLQHDSKTPKQ